MRLLLVEDDKMIGRGLMTPFEQSGIATDWVRTGGDALEALKAHHYSIMVLDIGLPDFSGLEVLAQARRAGIDAPVLLLTARDGVDERVKGLDLGADDYLAKPFALNELMARVRALSRRRSGVAHSLLEGAGMSLDLASRTLSFDGQKQQLSAREFALMRALLERPGTILSRSQLEHHLYSWGSEVESNAIDVLIHCIRRKFGKAVIRNVRGAGWMVVKGEG